MAATKNKVDVSKLDQNDLLEIAKQLAALGIQTQAQPVVVNQNVRDSVVFIKSNLYGKVALMLDKLTEVVIADSRDRLSLDISQVNIILSKTKYKALFAQGLLYFDDDKWYSYFGLNKPKYILTDEVLAEIFNKADSVFEALKAITNNGESNSLMNFIPYKLAELVKNGMLQINYKDQLDIERFLSTDKMPVTLAGLYELLEDRLANW